MASPELPFKIRPTFVVYSRKLLKTKEMLEKSPKSPALLAADRLLSQKSKGVKRPGVWWGVDGDPPALLDQQAKKNRPKAVC